MATMRRRREALLHGNKITDTEKGGEKLYGRLLTLNNLGKVDNAQDAVEEEVTAVTVVGER
jgi:hypothetical protein